MKHGQVGEAMVLIIGLVVVLLVILNTATVIANTGAMLTTNTTVGLANQSSSGAGANQTDASRAMVPLISFLWVAMAIAVALGGALLFLGKK